MKTFPPLTKHGLGKKFLTQSDIGPHFGLALCRQPCVCLSTVEAYTLQRMSRVGASQFFVFTALFER